MVSLPQDGYAFLLGIIQHGGKQAQLELEGQHVHTCGLALAAFHDDFLRDAATLRLLESAGGIAVKGGPSFLVDLGLKGGF